MSTNEESPLIETPQANRKGLFPIAMVLFSFTFSTGTMYAGGKIGDAFNFVVLLWITAIGNQLLALYAESLGLISTRSGLD
ncbi:cytosine permease, partial [Acinetobacter baumannii]|nr:cytosine permease [Acinetobacter baumannii]